MSSLIKLVLPLLVALYSISILDHIFLFANPFLIHRLLKALQDQQSVNDIVQPVFLLFAASVGRTACESQLYWISRRMDVRIRSAIIGTVYGKCLRRRSAISDQAGASPLSGVGAVTNLMSSDTDLILACFRQSHYIVSVPLLISLVIICIYIYKAVS